MIQAWLHRDEGDFHMTDDEVVIPPIAVIPKTGMRGGYQADADATKPAVPTTGSGVTNGDEVVSRAAAARAEAEEWLAQQQQERDRLQIMVTEATLAIEAANKRTTALQLDNVELRNNLQTLSATCEDLRQEASDLRAVFSSILAQLEHYEIPLPIRKRAGKLKTNGDSP